MIQTARLIIGKILGIETPLRLLKLVFVFVNLFGPNAIAEDAYIKKTLIVIGYADDNTIRQPSDVFQKKYHFDIAVYSARVISQKLLSLGYRLTPDSNKFLNEWISADGHKLFQVMNTNMLCPDESLENVRRFKLCNEQIQKIDLAIEFFQSDRLNKFDEFIYIGHARNGLGLGIGPFIPEFTLKLDFFNSAELGRLKKILFASCDSQRLYSDLERRVTFQGTKGYMKWKSDLIPIVLEELDRIGR